MFTILDILHEMYPLCFSVFPNVPNEPGQPCVGEDRKFTKLFFVPECLLTIRDGAKEYLFIPHSHYRQYVLWSVFDTNKKCTLDHRASNSRYLLVL